MRRLPPSGDPANRQGGGWCARPRRRRCRDPEFRNGFTDRGSLSRSAASPLARVRVGPFRLQWRRRSPSISRAQREEGRPAIPKAISTVASVCGSTEAAIGVERGGGERMLAAHLARTECLIKLREIAAGPTLRSGFAIRL